MKRSDITATLQDASRAGTAEGRSSFMLVAIFQLLYAIAEDMDVFEDEEETDD